MTIPAKDFRCGMKFDHNGRMTIAVSFAVKDGKVYLKARDYMTKQDMELVCSEDEEIKLAEIEETKTMTFESRNGDTYNFFDMETFSSCTASAEALAPGFCYVAEGTDCILSFYNGEVVEVSTEDDEVFALVEEINGNVATTDTGAEIEVPSDVVVGDRIVINIQKCMYRMTFNGF